MRALWSDRPNCSHSVSQKVKRIKRFSDFGNVKSHLLFTCGVTLQARGLGGPRGLPRS